MKKICHIRCNDKYWEELNIYSRYVKIKKQYSYYKRITELWDINLKIKYLSFRKQIRDIMLNHISNIGCFDIILESDQHCRQYFENNSSENIIFYQQDDDDIFLFLPELHDLQQGINIFQYSFIDPIGGRRKKGYKNRQYSFHWHKVTDGCVKNIQSNHCLIYNKNNEIDINEHFLYEADHTYYDRLLQGNHNSHINKYPISIQFYHLSSISVWKHQFRYSKYNYCEENRFLQFVQDYINQLQEIYITNMKRFPDKIVPLLDDVNALYKQLL